jgi:hypothetical protein
MEASIKYITHFFYESLPEKGRKHLSFLTSTKENITKGLFKYGYNGSRLISEKEIHKEILEGNLFRLAKPQLVSEEKSLWIDQDGRLWLTSDKNENPLLIEKTSLTPIKKASKIFNRVFAEKLPKICTESMV